MQWRRWRTVASNEWSSTHSDDFIYGFPLLALESEHMHEAHAWTQRSSNQISSLILTLFSPRILNFNLLSNRHHKLGLCVCAAAATLSFMCDAGTDSWIRFDRCMCVCVIPSHHLSLSHTPSNHGVNWNQTLDVKRMWAQLVISWGRKERKVLPCVWADFNGGQKESHDVAGFDGQQGLLLFRFCSHW